MFLYHFLQKHDRRNVTPVRAILQKLVKHILETKNSLIKAILKEGLDVIGMVKQLKQRYNYCGKAYTLPQLRKFVCFDGSRDIFGSLVVTTRTGIPVKLVFVRNRNKKSECLYLLSTDCGLSDAEIVRIYGNRWSIECFFQGM